MKKRIITVIIIAVTFFLPLISSYILAPNLKKYRTYNPRYTALMQYRVLQNLHRGESYAVTFSYIPLKEVPPYFIKGLLFSEDCNFYNHHGLDLGAVKDSFFSNLSKHRIFSGGSTITMQLSKNLFLSPKKTMFRKLTEMWIALRMEHSLSKSRILELYINLIEWGRGIYGLEAASQHYFQKSARDLSVEESAQLIAMIPAPLRYQPDHPNKVYQQRIARVLSFLVSGNVTANTEPFIEEIPYEEFILNESETPTTTVTASEPDATDTFLEEKPLTDNILVTENTTHE